MKILKKNELSLFIKPFGIKDKIFLSLGVLVYFDLLSPENLPGEQKLWGEVPPLLGDTPILDMGFPKPRGEFLVVGKCYSPTKKPIPVSEVMVKVGNIEKKLYVFGNRFWEKKLGRTTISEPSSFVKMEISWKNAFGGQGFEKNPVGKGIIPVEFGDGIKLIPLPNIEYPDQLIVSPSDRPEPACFGPVDMMWPQRAKKRGTYDDKWLRERWPYFPDDMDYEFFNMASEDQFLPDYFKGDEEIEIHNMHPEYPIINSRLPKIRVRAFVTKKKDIKGSEDDENLIFEEVNLKIDTLWLFPEILRGVVIFRGLSEIQDEELDDVHRIFLAMEDPSKELEPIEKYFEEQKKFFDRAVQIDKAPIENAQKKIANLLKRVKNLPKEMDVIRKKAMGKTPVMPLGSPKEMEKKFHTMIDNQLATIDTIEAQCMEMHAKWGHFAKIPTKEFFDKIRTKLTFIKEQIPNTMQKVQNALDKKEITKEEVIKQLKENLPKEQLEQAGVSINGLISDFDQILQEESINPWHDKGFSFVVRCRKNLENHPEIIKKLEEIGFTKYTISTHWFGFNFEEEKYPCEEWGIEKDENKEIVLPKGLVLPRFNEKMLTRILIRKEDLLSGEDILVEGSDKKPLFIPAATILDIPGNQKKESAPAIRVHDEFQARFLEQEIGDCCSIVVIEKPSDDLPEEAKDAISKTDTFLILLTEKEANTEIKETFFSIYPDCKILVMDKGYNLFEMYKNGVNIRAWIMENMLEDFAEENKVDFDFLNMKNGFVFPKMNIKEMVQKTVSEIRASYKSHVESMKKEIISEIEKKVKDSIANTDLPPEDILNEINFNAKLTSLPNSASFDKDAERIIKSLEKVEQQLKDKGILTEDIKATLDEDKSSLLKLIEESKARIEKGIKHLEQAKEKIEKVKSGDIPDDIKAEFEKAGIDSNKIKKLTREEVVYLYEKNKSLEGKILSNLDLSELDLRGVNLKDTVCINTNFKGAILDGASLSKIIAKGADFSGASMKSITVNQGILSEASMKGADLEGAFLKMCTLDKTNFDSANMKNAKIEMSTLTKSLFKKVTLEESYINMCILNGTEIEDSTFKNAKLEKCIFQKSNLKNVDFSSSYIKSTLFFETKGGNISFKNSTIDNGRMGKNSCFKNADFRDTNIFQACFRESDLSNSDFTGSKIENSIFEKCNLNKAIFFLVPLKQCRLLKCNLEEANMRGVNLFLGSLKKSRLIKTDLRDSNLYSLNFYKTVFGKTKIKGANLKKTFLEKREEFLSSEEID
ncbi:DUF2169 domain-containing protein [Deferribacter abyssi]|uniref:DUF2169 domain-containing protein n=1 Tax=Deferribacter abyssi TaxID=213806 RepID=UPI003C1EC87E